jgi:hypothetical protein
MPAIYLDVLLLVILLKSCFKVLICQTKYGIPFCLKASTLNFESLINLTVLVATYQCDKLKLIENLASQIVSSYKQQPNIICFII